MSFFFFSEIRVYENHPRLTSSYRKSWQVYIVTFIVWNGMVELCRNIKPVFKDINIMWTWWLFFTNTVAILIFIFSTTCIYRYYGIGQCKTDCRLQTF